MKPLQVNYVQANGDCAILIYFKRHPQFKLRLHALAKYIRAQHIFGVVEVVPAFDSLMLVFNQPSGVDDKLMVSVKEACVQSLGINVKPQLHEIPVCYHPDLAADLETVLKQTGLTLEQLITVHSEPTYTVDFLGFLPGFAYIDGLPTQLNIPRKSKTSQNTPAGSIAIANRQTGIYALDSPGGWHVIGRTPIKLIDWQTAHNIIYQPLDQIRFKAMSYDAFI
ncbi:5-oxoprolinase subunit PxpB [Marinicella gelatinilytica]|uniref:5-oxoprolinase subunit PxpB n=1 Tax=Marinicella gelatinilytica TaxID=2996017 RepID=UPI002260F290|nr:5-oxoprolinase subunit PxpB [Marinicella gelatinilytica]MCX7545031.1 5-oxoprolinase subunit PxpB [Marinicella gelatinilytica]